MAITAYKANIANHTTFGIDVPVRLVDISAVDELREALVRFPQALVIGGGSNIVVTAPPEQPVLRILLKGHTVLSETPEHVTVYVAAGEQWHGFVEWCVQYNLGGLENLALIPGTTGAAPIQNIGAYGVEQESCFVELTGIERSTGRTITLQKQECKFGYRDSVFKRERANQIVIIGVTYRLAKPPYTPHAQYKDVAELLSNNRNPTIQDVFQAVIQIRRQKLPDPAEIGNAGSFFKNPIVSRVVYQELKQKYPELPSYHVDDDYVKLPAAWLIDRCGWKGKRCGAVGVHSRQALVIINYGGATGNDVRNLAVQIANDVYDTFGVTLEPEVSFW